MLVFMLRQDAAGETGAVDGPDSPQDRSGFLSLDLSGPGSWQILTLNPRQRMSEKAAAGNRRLEFVLGPQAHDGRQNCERKPTADL